MTNKSLIVLFFSTLSYTSCTQPDLKYKSVEIVPVTIINNKPIQDNSESIGTAFIVKNKDNYVLVTNYHLLTGKESFNIPKNYLTYVRGETPNSVFVKFYTKSTQKIGKVYRLLDDNNRRLFLTPEWDSNRVIDLAFLPLTDIPDEAVIDPIDLSKQDTTWKIDNTSDLLVYGFRGDREFALEFPIIDTVKPIKDYPFYYADPYIFGIKTIKLGGSSGGPVFYNSAKGDKILVGIVSIETNTPITIVTLPEARRIRELQLVYEFVSISTIKKEFAKLFPD